MIEHADEPPLGKIMRALSFAAAKHRDQRRKDVQASPYINHPIGLAAILADEAGVTDPITICAALLHDTIEDTETTAGELKRHFGQEIASIVMEVTDDKSLPKDERKQRQIDHAASSSEKAKLVKLADKISNLRDIAASPPAHWDLKRKQQYFDWAAEVVDQVRGANPRLEALFDIAAKERPKANTPGSPAAQPTSAISRHPQHLGIVDAPPESYDGGLTIVGYSGTKPRKEP